MFRQSPSRNQRSKGFKVKHVVQICLLVAVCIWLLYQAKHSHDKKKEFESIAKISENVVSGEDIIKLGRKDLHPREEESTSETHRQNDEEETEEENKAEEEEGRRGGDDEIDEHDRVRAKEETEHPEDSIDEEEKEREERENEKEGLHDNTGSSEDQDHDRDRTTQEAREEHYKGDDASSAVVRDTQEIENGYSGGSNVEEQVESAENKSEQENKSQSIGEVNADQNDSGLKIGEGEKVEAIPSVNATLTDEKGTEETLAESKHGSTSNPTITTESNNQKEVNDNSTADDAKTPILSLQSGTETITDPNEHQNASQASGSPTEGDNNLQTAVLEQTENPNATDRVEKSATSGVPNEASSNSGSVVSEVQAVESNVTAGAEDGSASSTTSETAESVQSEKSETEENSDGSTSSTTNENSNAAEHDATDSSDESILQEVKEARTDLGTLPETETEGTNHDDVTTE
ncbi:dentin sialophosphoprotein-like isoform X3 [Telopea speciosissima]|uniref:dentin sialophosphoprotein-like isoform X3 n=1 Tax=Telopea speciosissima TaxID=54955 RepID=UPI001CC43B68|nr:dentin sialophosphoprotein-like isoform X3 [Telopea speciosissima]